MVAEPPSVDEIFEEAIQHPPGEERSAYLDSACGDDANLRQRVERLLRAFAEAGSFLESPATDALFAVPLPISEPPGTPIGPYRLLQQIGEGGMGVVYEAEQDEPVQRRVALKVIKPGMDSRQVLARFETERQALALMDHPHIARVLDAGTTDSGRPYFVMELVSGIPITEYCDQQQLSPRQRLELLLPICQAVQHAHQKGIVHRDLKPSNILVAQYDGQPVPKVIDFGVAKAIGEVLDQQTVVTQYGQILGTLEYMSPEQTQRDQVDIDTRSDIYALGVLLYELLTGMTPFDKARLRTAKFDELLQIIREEEPPRPSLRLSRSDTLAAAAASRRTEPQKLSSILRGELDWIVMKALEKDRARRYQTASDLAADIEHYLNNEPVAASPPSTAYRFRKFSQRNKTLLATVILVAVTMLIGILGTSWQAILANHRLARAQEAEQLADQQAQRANAAARQQSRLRTEAEQQRQLADDRQLTARKNLYAAHMTLAQQAHQNGHPTRVLSLLERHVPAPGEPDWRSFEWHYLLAQCHRDELTITPARYGVAFSPDGTLLACGGKGKIEIWDMARAERLIALEDDQHNVWALAFSPDGKILASGSLQTENQPGQCILWDTATWHQMASLPHENSIVAIDFAPSGETLATSDGGHLDLKGVPGVIRLWDVATREPLHVLNPNDRWVSHLSFSPDGQKLATCSELRRSFDCVVRVWSLGRGEPREEFEINGRCGAWSSDSTHLAVALNGKLPVGRADVIAQWNVAVQQETGRFAMNNQMPMNQVYSMAYSPDGHLLAVGMKDAVHIWNAETGIKTTTLYGHGYWIFDLAFSPDGNRLASASSDGMAKVWSTNFARDLLQGGQSPRTTIGKLSRDHLCISPDGSLLAATHDQTQIVIMDLDSEQVRTRLDVGSVPNALSFSADGASIAMGARNELQTWDATSGQLLSQCRGSMESLSVSRGEGHVVVGGGGQLSIHHRDTLTKLSTVATRRTMPAQIKIAVSPDGKTLASANFLHPIEVRVWRLPDLHLSLTLKGQVLDRYLGRSGGRFKDLAFSPDGKQLAVSGGNEFAARRNGVTVVFDVASGRRLARFAGRGGLQTAVAFSPDRKTIATGQEAGDITLWDLETHEERISFRWPGHEIDDLAFSPGGKTLISGDAKEAVKLWKTASDRHVAERERKGLHRRALAYADDGEWQKAADLLSYLLGMADDELLRHYRATVYAELARWEDAIKDYADLTGLPSSSPQMWYEMAVAQLAEGNEPDYRTTCAAALERFPTDRHITWACVIKPQQLDWPRTIARATVPFTVSEPAAADHKILGAILYRAGLYHDAAQLLAQATSAVQQGTSLSTPAYQEYFLAMAHHRMGHQKEAQMWFEKAQRDIGGPPQLSQGNTVRSTWSRRAVLHILHQEAENLLAADTIGRQSTQPMSPAAAIELYSAVLELQPDTEVILRCRARAYSQLGKTARAEEDLKRCEHVARIITPLRSLTRLVKEIPTTSNWLLRAEFQLNVTRDYDAALSDCQEAFKFGGAQQVYRGREVRCLAYLALHDESAYRRECLAGLRQPDFGRNWGSLERATRLVALRPWTSAELESPLELAQNAVEEDLLKNERHVANYGALLYRAGRYDEALARLNSATEARDEGHDWLFLAMVHAALGDAREAHQCYQRAIDWTKQVDVPGLQFELLQDETKGILESMSQETTEIN